MVVIVGGLEQENITENAYLILINTFNGDSINITESGTYNMEDIDYGNYYVIYVSEESNLDTNFECIGIYNNRGYSGYFMTHIEFACNWKSNQLIFVCVFFEKFQQIYQILKSLNQNNIEK